MTRMYWQFKNGTIAPISYAEYDDAFFSMRLGFAWDRSKGAWIHYQL